MWKPAKNLEDHFLVSIDGKIKNKKTGRILKTSEDNRGYFKIVSRIGGRKGKVVHIKPHRIVAETFIPNHDNHPVVNHKDGNKKNNHIDNLEWCSYSYNTYHYYKELK